MHFLFCLVLYISYIKANISVFDALFKALNTEMCMNVHCLGLQTVPMSKNM